MSHIQKRVLGVDPGLTRCGIGIVEGAIGKPPSLVGVGVILTAADLPLEKRLLQLETELEEWIVLHKPDVIAVERVFSQHNRFTISATCTLFALPEPVTAALTSEGVCIITGIFQSY